MSIVITREDIARTVDDWHRFTHRQTFLSEPLHPKARIWLIEHIEKLLTEKGLDLAISAPVAPEAPPLAPAPPPPAPAATDEPTMDDLKGRLRSKGGKAGKK